MELLSPSPSPLNGGKGVDGRPVELSKGALSPGLNPLILSQTLPPSTSKSSIVSAFTSLIFKYLVLSLVLSMKIVPGFKAAYLFASKILTF